MIFRTWEGWIRAVTNLLKYWSLTLLKLLRPSVQQDSHWNATVAQQGKHNVTGSFFFSPPSFFPLSGVSSGTWNWRHTSDPKVPRYEKSCKDAWIILVLCKCTISASGSSSLKHPRYSSERTASIRGTFSVPSEVAHSVLGAGSLNSY